MVSQLNEDFHKKKYVFYIKFHILKLKLLDKHNINKQTNHHNNSFLYYYHLLRHNKI